MHDEEGCVSHDDDVTGADKRRGRGRVLHVDASQAPGKMRRVDETVI